MATPADLARIVSGKLEASRRAAEDARRARLRKAGVRPVLTRAELASLAAARSDQS